MKVTDPMIQRGLLAVWELDPRDRADTPTLVEAILRRALNDPKTKLPDVIPGQVDIYEALENG